MGNEKRKVTHRKTIEECLDSYMKNRDRAMEKAKRVNKDITAGERLRKKLDKIEEEETICYQFTLFSVKFKDK